VQAVTEEQELLIDRFMKFLSTIKEKERELKGE